MSTFRTVFIMTAAYLNLAGCEAIARAQAEQAAQRQAYEDNIRERVAQLSPEQKDAVQKCSSESAGRINTLRNAGQGGAFNGWDDYALVNACLGNAYYYSTIPAPAVVINVPPPQQPNPYALAPLPSQRTINCNTMATGYGNSTTTCN
jgi:hypothetical protein